DVRLQSRLQDRLGLGSARRHGDAARGRVRAQGPGDEADGGFAVGHTRQRRAVPHAGPNRQRRTRQVRRSHRRPGQPAQESARVPGAGQPARDHESGPTLQESGVRWRAALLGMLVLAAPCVAAGELTFAGFSRATTMDELKARFPTSSFADNYVYVSDADARDHIYGVQIPGRNASAPLRLTFERPAERTKSRHPEYPACATL